MSDLARVIPLRPRPGGTTYGQLAEVRELRPARPRRRSRNGHHADCPYPERPAEHCGICASMRKGRDTIRAVAAVPTQPAEEPT